ncbi:GntR family transcriptional regulator [Gammaproteobacteria bacterium]|nr:GntR family transcriptional regulator [Gammaproteobacteria bacterium]
MIVDNLNTSTLADRAYAAISRRIVDGELQPGERIREPELSNTLGLGRGIIREALSRLEASGLITRQPNLGARVVPLTAELLTECYQLREALESLAARLAAEHMPSEEVAELQALLDQHATQVEDESGQRYFQEEGDLDFHYRLVRGSRSPRLMRYLGGDLYHLTRLFRVHYGMNTPRARPALAEHRAIVDAIAAKDGEMADVLMKHHIRASRRNAEARFQSASHKEQRA